MKKTLLLTLAAGLVCTMQVKAVDLYITGSTAFRANVHDACLKLFSPAATEFTGTVATGGDTKTGNAAAQWTMTGTPIAGLTAISGTLTIHALFTGSVQGAQTVESGTKLLFVSSTGTLTTNTATIAFSDCATASTPYPVDGSTYNEEQVAVQPFVFCKAIATGNGLSSITNVTWDQIKYGVQAGRIPLAAWTSKSSDIANYVYLIERTKDSGTRRTEFAQVLDGFNQSAIVYLYDNTNNFFYKTNTSIAGGTGSSAAGVGVVGAAGNGNANLNWGSGYVGGGDVKTELGYNNAANQAIGYLSLSDAKGITGVNYSQVLPFNGGWPTAGGSAISGNTGTNDFSPITLGTYPGWGYEVVVYPLVDASSINPDQNLTAAQLGDQNTAGTILGVLDSQGAGTPLVGSLQNEIELSKPSGATAIRLSDMVSSRASVGGTITP